MIGRLLVKNHLSFESCDLEFKEGLMAFTGPSGAGKSVLMQALLSLFGFCDANASLVEATIEKKIGLDEFGLEEDEPNVFKYVKDKSTRYFVNMQSVSKKSMAQIANSFVSYLSIRDENEFNNEKLIELIDAIVAQKDALHVKSVSAFNELYESYLKDKTKLDDLEEKEKKIEELKEFVSFEIKKIEDIAPKIGEDEELLSFKRSLSKKEKIEQSINKAYEIFNFENYVSEALSLIEKESAFFDEAINELRAIFEEQKERLDELEEIDVEALLDRIEKISSLKSRYGSIEEILEYKSKKEKELQEYENISFEKEALVKSCKEKLAILQDKAKQISQKRNEQSSVLNKKINDYLIQLYMPPISLDIQTCEMYEQGIDFMSVKLGEVNIKKISSGEYNRLRLAFIATSSDILQSGSGVLILDEIDANLSGKEAMSVANVLKELSYRYQIFAISHQPQLSSRADFHFVVTKKDAQSSVALLDDNQRVQELARMVSGEEVSEEALLFAKTLMDNR
jgi:DNA repair protein RecN (Recombination protein N)